MLTLESDCASPRVATTWVHTHSSGRELNVWQVRPKHSGITGGRRSLLQPQQDLTTSAAAFPYTLTAAECGVWPGAWELSLSMWQSLCRHHTDQRLAATHTELNPCEEKERRPGQEPTHSVGSLIEEHIVTDSPHLARAAGFYMQVIKGGMKFRSWLYPELHLAVRFVKSCPRVK